MRFQFIYFCFFFLTINQLTQYSKHVYIQFKNKVRVATIWFPFVQAKVQCKTCCLIFYQFSQHIECEHRVFYLLPLAILLSKWNQFCERGFEICLRPFLYVTITCWSMYSSWSNVYALYNLGL